MTIPFDLSFLHYQILALASLSTVLNGAAGVANFIFKVATAIALGMAAWRGMQERDFGAAKNGLIAAAIIAACWAIVNAMFGYAGSGSPDINPTAVN
jgi:cytochrome bd-type quinol oxidase subunit 1